LRIFHQSHRVLNMINFLAIDGKINGALPIGGKVNPEEQKRLHRSHAKRICTATARTAERSGLFQLSCKKLGNLSRVIDFFQIEKSVFQFFNSRPREDARSEQAEFTQNLFPRHGVPIASFGVEDFLAIAFPIPELNLQLYAVASFVAETIELKVFNNFDPFGGCQNIGAANCFFRNLIDEEVAVVKQNGDAEEKIHLRCGHALGLVGPADVEFGSAGGSNADLFDVLCADLRVLAQDFLESVDGRVIAAATGIRFETDVERLKPFA
jgi:hypothetical protein